MNAAIEFDLGPLTWVKGEVDLALGRAEEALRQCSGGADPIQFKFCRTHVHQVHGALAIVGLDGLTQITDGLEALLLALEEGKLQATPEVFACSEKALVAIRNYLDDLMAGEPNQTLRLFPVYEALAIARGGQRVRPTDLFYPDLSLRPPPRPSSSGRLSPERLRLLLRKERTAFQKGLLAWLKKSDMAADGLQRMRLALENIEASQDSPSARAFWWVSLGFLEALAARGAESEAETCQLCARIDLQIRRLQDGSRNVAERLMRDALYYVAKSPEDRGGVLAAVHNTFSLDRLVPPPDSAEAEVGPQEASLLRRLREAIVAAEEFWSKFCAGSTGMLASFAEQARHCDSLVVEIGQTDLKRLGQGIGAVAQWLLEQPSRHSEAVGMEVATAILLLHNAQENFKHLGTDFAQLVDQMVERLHACIAGKPVAGASAVPLLDDMTRRAQEKLLIGQVAREIQNNLLQIEQALDAFFRAPEAGHDLAQLDAPLNQAAGALTMLGHDGALESLHWCGEEIKRFASSEYVPANEDFEAVAQQLSIIGFFIDSMPHGNADFGAFVRKLTGEVDEISDEFEESAQALPPGTVETELEQQKRETKALVEALRESPADAALKDELKQSLQSLQKDADLVDDLELGETAKAALSALEAGEEAVPELDAALALIKPTVVDAPAPSAETLQLAQSSHEEIDAELLAIFIEEAHEVLATMAENFAALTAEPHNIDALSTIRRSTHTLKGSGRMVGLRDLGETAWAVEQTLNNWLRRELEVSPELLELVAQEQALFVAWVAHLENAASTPAPDPSELIALAERLRGSDGLPTPAATVPPPASAQIIELPLAKTAQPAPSDTVELLPTEALDPGSLEVDFGGEDFSLFVDEDAAKNSAETDFGLEVGDTELSEKTCEAPDLIEVAEVSDPMGEMGTLLESEPLGFADVVAALEPIEPIESVQEIEPLESVEPAPDSGPTLHDIFREEARGHMETLSASYRELELNPFAPTSFEMTRAAHTLGGIAAIVGLTPINKLAIVLEHALLRRDGSGRPDSIEGLETVRQAIICLEDMFAGLREQRDPAPAPAMIEALEEIYPPVAESESAASHPETVGQKTDSEAEQPEHAAAVEIPVLQVANEESPRLQDEFDEQLLPVFLEEAQDIVQGFGEQLRNWRANPEDSAAPQALARQLHTFKGGARMAGAMNLGEMTHHLETRVEEIVHAGHVATSQIDEVENGCDTLEQIVERLLAGETVFEPPQPLVPAVVAVIDEVAPLAVPLDAPAPVAPAHEVPPISDGEAESAAQRATLRVRADLLDRMINEAGELSIARTRIEGEMLGLKGSLLELTENVIRLRRQLREIEIQAESQMQARVALSQEKNADFDPLELDRFTRFQELARFMAESVNDVATVQQNLLKNLDEANAAILAQARLNRSLQQDLRGVRMVPFATQSDRLYRIARQTAKEIGKRANLDIRGGQVEIDRSVLDKMMAPLEHMLRNAISHGIEARDIRLAQGKPEVGEITLALAQEGNELIVSMTDDGRGIDAQRVRASAVERGMLAPDAVVDDAHLFDFIFQPGFSTASEVTRVAGRGVGMDVVKTEITGLGGRIETTSTPGQGTNFRLYLPLTLAVTQTVLVRAGTSTYAIPSAMVEQVQEVREKHLNTLRENGEISWMDHHYPLRFLPHLLGETDTLPEARRQYWILLLRSGTQRVAIHVDDLLGNQEVVVKNVGSQLARVVGINGATVLGDGQVVLILNPAALDRRASVLGVAAPVAKAIETEPVVSANLPTIMVVDDSLTVRKITSRLLAREGYQVVTAKDGVDALEELLEFKPDVLLSDIEMPRMDGFDLVRNVRNDERLKDLPIIMITSRTAEKHRNYALEIGANHYLGKPYDEDDLLGLIAGYVQAKRAS